MSDVEEAITRLRRERKGKRVVAIYFTIFKPSVSITEEDAYSILNTLGMRGAGFSTWVTFTKAGDTAFLDAMLSSAMFPSGGGWRLSGEYPEGLLDVTYVIIPQGRVKVDDVYALVRGLSVNAVSRLGGSRYVVKLRVFGSVGELGVLRNRLTELGVYDTYLLGDEGELVVNLLTPTQVLDRGVYEAVFGLGD